MLLLAFGCLGGLRGFFVLALEAFNAPCCIDKLLLAREKRVALRADFDPHEIPFIGRARFESTSAGAMNRNFVIIGVDTGFHDCSIPQAVLRGSRLWELQPRR